MKAIENYWEGLELQFGSYNECNILEINDEMIEQLDKNSMELMSMSSTGKTVEFFRDRVTR